jgi:hypothetical protein
MELAALCLAAVLDSLSANGIEVLSVSSRSGVVSSYGRKDALEKYEASGLSADGGGGDWIACYA